MNFVRIIFPFYLKRCHVFRCDFSHFRVIRNLVAFEKFYAIKIIIPNNPGCAIKFPCKRIGIQFLYIQITVRINIGIDIPTASIEKERASTLAGKKNNKKIGITMKRVFVLENKESPPPFSYYRHLNKHEEGLKYYNLVKY